MAVFWNDLEYQVVPKSSRADDSMHTGSHEAAIDIDGIDIDGEDATNVSCSFLFVGQVSEELIRVAILWHELWHEGLEEASRLYFGERNVQVRQPRPWNTFQCLIDPS